jgi:hypothetical protein
LCYQRSFSLAAHPIVRQSDTPLTGRSSILQTLRAFINSIFGHRWSRGSGIPVKHILSPQLSVRAAAAAGLGLGEAQFLQLRYLIYALISPDLIRVGSNKPVDSKNACS